MSAAPGGLGRGHALGAALLGAALCAWPPAVPAAPGRPSPAAVGPAPAAASAEPGAQPPQRCASGPQRDTYVSLRAVKPSELAALVAACERLGYRRIGGVAHAVVANPGAPSDQLYFQVMIVPAGAASAPSPGASSSG